MGRLGARGSWVAVVVLALAGCDGGTAAWMVSLASLGHAEPRPERLRRAHRRGASVSFPASIESWLAGGRSVAVDDLVGPAPLCP